MGIYRSVDLGYINILDFGAVGGTDDTTAIQNALDAGDIYIPPGFTFIVADLKPPSNRRIVGTWQSTLKLKNSTDAPVIRCQDVSNVVIDGISIDGNKSNQTGTACPGIFVEGGDHITITNVRIENTRIESILISKSESSSPPVIPTDVIVSNCLSINPSYSAGFRQHYAVTAGKRITIANNIAESTDGFAAYMVDLEPNNASNPIEDVTIVGNVGKTVGGVSLTSASGQIIKRVVVSGNSALGPGAGRGNHYIINNAVDVSFSGNVGDGAGLNGLEVTSASRVAITGNIIRNYAIDGTAGQKDGIHLTTATSVTISGNTIESSWGGAYGIRETASDCITYVGNNRLDVPVGNQVSLLSTNSVLNWRTFDKDGNRYGNLSFIPALGSSAALELAWTGSDLLLRNTAGGSMEFRTTTLRIGDPSVGYPIAGFISGTDSWNPPNLANGEAASVTSNASFLSTVAFGDTVVVSFEDAVVPGGAILSGQVTASGEVTVTLFNATGADLNLGEISSPSQPATLRIDVWQH